MALDRDSVKNTLFGNFNQQESINTPVTPDVPVIPPLITELEDASDGEEKEVPQSKMFEIVSAVLTIEQKAGLDTLAKKIMRSRTKDPTKNRQRITANTVLRAMLDNFLLLTQNAKISSIQNEEQLKEWMSHLINSIDIKSQ